MPIIVNISRDEFLSALASFQNITAKKGTIAILSNVLLEAENDTVQMTCTDLEIGLRHTIPAEVLSPGSITLPSKKLFEIVREAGSDHIHLKEKNNSWVEITIESGNYNVCGMESDEFPHFPEYNNDQLIEIKSSSLIDLVDKTSFSMANDGESQFTLTGILLEKHHRDDTLFLRFISSDGHRLSVMQVNAGEDINLLDIDNRKVIIPKKGIQEIRKFCEISDTISISIEEKQAVFKTNNSILIIRLMNGEFPDYQTLMNIIDREKFIEVNREYILHAFKRMSLFAEDKYNIVQFVLYDNKINLASQSMDIGNAREDISVNYEGDEIKLGFNGKYFIETLSVMKSENIKLFISSNESPCMVISDNDPEFISIIMPMHL